MPTTDTNLQNLLVVDPGAVVVATVEVVPAGVVVTGNENTSHM